jgi:hypothetical protein
MLHYPLLHKAVKQAQLQFSLPLMPQIKTNGIRQEDLGCKRLRKFSSKKKLCRLAGFSMEL